MTKLRVVVRSVTRWPMRGELFTVSLQKGEHYSKVLAVAHRLYVACVY